MSINLGFIPLYKKQVREFLNRKYSNKLTPTQNNNVRRIFLN